MIDRADIRACQELVQWWSTGILDQEGELARQADQHARQPGDRRAAERDLVERVIRWVASGELEDAAAREARVEVEAWKVEFENGAVEFHPASEIAGEPGFGRWVTPLVASGPAIDNEPDAGAG